jgi:hypothetical protein
MHLIAAIGLSHLLAIGIAADAAQAPTPPVGSVPASQHAAVTGRVFHGSQAVPGATVTAARGTETVSAVTNEEGAFRFAALAHGAWTITVALQGFGTVTREVSIPPGEPIVTVSLTLRPYAEIVGEGAVRSAWPAATLPSPPPAPTDPDAAASPEILNGSVVNGAATRFALPRASGNNRPRGSPLYSGAVTGNFGNSAWNARPYSFAGSAAAPPDYSDLQLGLTFAGPLRVPFTSWRGPQLRLVYSHGVEHSANTRSALVPTVEQRRGDLSDHTGVIVDPANGLAFPNNVIPHERIVPQATALLGFYPPPTGASGTGANFQRSLLTAATADRLQLDASQAGARTQVAGSIGYQRSLSDSVNLFGFEDRTHQSSVRATFHWTRRMTSRVNVQAAYEFTSSTHTLTPFFADRSNVSGDAGISGNAQDPANWGPPTIVFPEITDLTDGRFQRSSRRSHTVGSQVRWRRGVHNITFGADARLHAVNLETSADPRGTITFTGAATGHAFADFLLGIPTTSSIALGSLSTRLRGAQLDAFVDDDVRIAPGLTVAVGLRWEYESPYTEQDGRLANLDVQPGFSAVAPILGTKTSGPLTGNPYPRSLVRADRLGFEPRLGLSWRPFLASSLVIKSGYGLYRNLGVYESIGMLLAQQPPFSSGFSVQNTPEAPLTLANPFPASLPSTTTFAVDPDFRTALLHSWQVTAQRDLPGSLTVVAAYSGDRGMRLAQAFLPNTYAPGAENPCPRCPSSFTYLTSGGTSARNAAQLIVRRRLYAGLTASVAYTLAKATDNASTFSSTTVAPGSLSVAQNWLDLDAERGPSPFDQRHFVTAEVQYTTGVGAVGGTLVDGFWGRLYKDWTVTAQMAAGSGLPVSPVVFVAVPGTGVVGIRPSLTREPIRPGPDGAYANAAAFTLPAPGTWGDAGRNSLRGPATFNVDMSLTRTFRLRGRVSLDWRLSAANVLNRVTFTTIDRIVTSPQFGRPTNAGQMRRIFTHVGFRF